MTARALFMTGATGLIGGRVLRRLLEGDPGLHAFVLARDPERWRERAFGRDPERWRERAFGREARAGDAPRRPAADASGAGATPLTERVTPLAGDVTRGGLGLDAAARGLLADRATLVVHAAADTVFSRPLPAARRVNTLGTANVLELVDAWPNLERVLHVSTAFVAGRRVGTIREDATADAPASDVGFVNAYEQSKAEAEPLVRSSAKPWVIVRPSTVVCDGTHGHVSQFNAVHRALRLYHAGLASMLPGTEESPVDLVTADYVADCVSALAMASGVERTAFHLCAGGGAIPLGRLLDTSYAIWAESPPWRRRGIPRPAVTDLDTYRLFERTVHRTGDPRLRRITRSLSHFVPQLALPKRFETSATERVTGLVCPPVAEYWEAVVRYLLGSGWAASARGEARSRQARVPTRSLA